MKPRRLTFVLAARSAFTLTFASPFVVAARSVIVLALTAPALASPPPKQPAVPAPAPPPRRWARTVVAPPDLDLQSERVRAQAQAELGSRLEPADVRVTRDGDRLTVEVSGDGGDAAVARCLALVRACGRGAEVDETALRSLRDQRKALAAEIAVKRALADQPDPTAPLAGADEARARVFEVMVALDKPGPPDDHLLPLPAMRAAWEAELAVERELEEIRARGYGEQHPSVLQAKQRLELAVRRVEAQRAVEKIWGRALVADLDAPPPPRKEDRLARARVAGLVAAMETHGCAVASAAPPSLQAAADNCQRAAEEQLLLTTRYGEKHPALLAGRARLQAAQSSIDFERQAQASELRADLLAYAAPTTSAARGRLLLRMRAGLERENVRRIVTNLERESLKLADRIDALLGAKSDAARLRVIDRCALLP